MKSKSNLFLSILVVTLFGLGYVHGEGEADCQTVVSNLIKGQLRHVKTCLSEIKFADKKEKAKKMTCVLVCAMKRSGFIDDEGKADAAGSSAYLESQVPEALMGQLMEKFMDCHEFLALFKSTEEDPFCKSYEPMMKCAQEAMNKACQ